MDICDGDNYSEYDSEYDYESIESFESSIDPNNDSCYNCGNSLDYDEKRDFCKDNNCLISFCEDCSSAYKLCGWCGELRCEDCIILGCKQENYDVCTKCKIREKINTEKCKENDCTCTVFTGDCYKENSLFCECHTYFE